jgi:hypothetical protein
MLSEMLSEMLPEMLSEMLSENIGGGNHQPVASHWQSLSHNVVSSTPRHERASHS